jgi:TolB-like protein
VKLRSLFLFLTALIFLSVTGLSAEALRVSVLYFNNTSGSEPLDWLEKGLADMLLTDLALSKDIKGIEREDLEKVLNEQKFSLSGITDESRQLEIGRLLSAELILTGSFIEASGRLRIDGKVLDAETGELRAAVKTDGTLASIFEMEAEIAEAVFKALGLELPAGITKSKSGSLSAVESYYKGLALFDKGEYDKAVEYYRKAAVDDPEYGKPRAGLEESYKFLKDFRKMRYQREINKLVSDAAVLRNRLKTEPWLSYGDFILQAYSQGITDNAELTKQAEGMGLFSGETPATCAWNLQNILLETADLAIEYFEDEVLADYSKSEIVKIAREGRKKYSGDAFLPELIYQELLVAYYNSEYEHVLVLCEELMLGYPEYRMMWAVEDFYEDALEELSE